VEAQQSAHRERIGSNSPVAERQTSLVNQVVSDGNARYRNPRAFESWKIRKLEGLNLQPETFELFNRNRVVPRRNSFVPEWMKDFLFFLWRTAIMKMLLDEIRNAKPGVWKETLPLWIILNCIGFAAFMVVPSMGGLASFVIVGAGLFLGLLQWIALADLIGVDWVWSLASTPAYTALLIAYLDNDPIILASMPNDLASGDLQPHLFVMVLKITFWLAVWGLLQWLVLRQFLYRALVWPIASSAAGFLGALVALAATFIASPTGTLSPLLFWTFFALIYIPITGITLIVLKILPKPTKQDVWY
jgi:hypothetical protein